MTHTVDYNNYVGIPWKCGHSALDGSDCWGLVCMVYKDLFNLDLEHFEIQRIDDQNKTMVMIESVREESDWESVDVPQEGDVVMMIGRVSLRPEHVGVYTNHGRVLHSLSRNPDTGQSEIHDMKLLRKIFKRLEFYRYVA